MIVGLVSVIGLAIEILESSSTAEPVQTTLDVSAGTTDTPLATTPPQTPTTVVVVSTEATEPGLQAYVLLIAVTLVPGALLIRSGRRRGRPQSTGEPSDQHQEQ